MNNAAIVTDRLLESMVVVEGESNVHERIEECQAMLDFCSLT